MVNKHTCLANQTILAVGVARLGTLQYTIHLNTTRVTHLGQG